MTGSEDIAEILRLHTEARLFRARDGGAAGAHNPSRLSLPRETILSFFDPIHEGYHAASHRIKAPVLVTHGARIASSHCRSEEIVAHLPNARLYASSRKGSPPIFTATTDFCNVVKCFVGSRSRPRFRNRANRGHPNLE